MRTTSLGGARYFVTYIDNFSRKVWVYLLKSKGECLEKFKELKALVETQSEHKIKVFPSDNGREYISKEFKRFLRHTTLRSVRQLLSLYSRFYKVTILESINATGEGRSEHISRC
jgi:transposase InsO family protein